MAHHLTLNGWIKSRQLPTSIAAPTERVKATPRQSQSFHRRVQALLLAFDIHEKYHSVRALVLALPDLTGRTLI
jgi:hypothetical protein